MTTAEQSNLDVARQYLEAVERGVTGDTLAAFFTPDVAQEEFPNRLTTHGARRDLTGLLDAAARGQQIMAAQRYELLNAMAAGAHVALEVQWSGTLAVPVAGLPPGREMRARLAILLEFRD